MRTVSSGDQAAYAEILCIIQVEMLVPREYRAAV